MLHATLKSGCGLGDKASITMYYYDNRIMYITLCSEVYNFGKVSNLANFWKFNKFNNLPNFCITHTIIMHGKIKYHTAGKFGEH